MMINILVAALLAASWPVSRAESCSPAVPTYVSVPSTGYGPTIAPSDGYRVETFGKGAYMITDGLYQSLFLVTTRSVIAVDAPPTIGNKLLKAIRSVTSLPISHLVYSHAHADHIGAAYLLVDRNTKIIAHRDTERALAPAIDDSRPKPNITFTKGYKLKVDNQTLHLSYKGTNHEPGNIFIYAPVQKVLMLVDVIYPGWIPYARLGESQNIPGWIKAHDQVLEYDLVHYVGGHLNRVGTRTDVLTQKEYVTDLYNNCVQAIQLSAAPPNATNQLSVQANLPVILAANPGNQWAASKYLDDISIDYCVNKTNAKWLGRLAGADVYDKSNAETMLESLKIDFGYLGPFGVAK